MNVSAKLPRIDRGEISRIKGRGANTFLIKGEMSLFQRDGFGNFKEFALVRAKHTAFLEGRGLAEDAITFDDYTKQYVIKVGSGLYTVNLPDRVTACADKVVTRELRSARLSEQMITIGPDPQRMRRHSVLSRLHR